MKKMLSHFLFELIHMFVFNLFISICLSSPYQKTESIYA